MDLMKLSKKHTAMAGFIRGIIMSSKMLVVVAFKDLADSIMVWSKDSRYPIISTAFREVKPRVCTETIPHIP